MARVDGPHGIARRREETTSRVGCFASGISQGRTVSGISSQVLDGGSLLTSRSLGPDAQSQFVGASEVHEELENWLRLSGYDRETVSVPDELEEGSDKHKEGESFAVQDWPEESEEDMSAEGRRSDACEDDVAKGPTPLHTEVQPTRPLEGRHSTSLRSVTSC